MLYAYRVAHSPDDSRGDVDLDQGTDPVAYMKQLPSQWRLRVPDSQVDGAIRIWGRCVEHRSGYRAQYAEVALLCTPNTDLCKKYGAEQFNGTFFELVEELQGGKA